VLLLSWRIIHGHLLTASSFLFLTVAMGGYQNPLLFLGQPTLSLQLSRTLEAYIFVNGPVKDIVVLESLTNKEVAEELTQVRIIGLVVEAERANIVEVDRKLLREAPAENVCGCSHLLLHDTIVLLFLGRCFQSLPWK